MARARGLVRAAPGATFAAVRADPALLWSFYVDERARAVVSLGDLEPSSASAWTRRNDVTLVRVPGAACAVAPREFVALSLEGEDLLVVKSVDHPLADGGEGAVRAGVTFAARAVFWTDAGGVRRAGEPVCELQVAFRAALGGAVPAAVSNFVNVRQVLPAVFARVRRRVREASV